MNLSTDNDFKERQNKKLKSALIVIFTLITILVLTAIGIWLYGTNMQKNKFKVYIDGVQSGNAAANTSLFLIEDGKVYTSIKDIVQYIGYTLYNGEYKQYTEDTTQCYATNKKELVTFASGSAEIRKYDLFNPNSESQSFKLDEQVTMRGDKLYISEKGLERAFNIVLDYDPEQNNVQIATLPYLVTYWEKQITDASLTDNNLSESIQFNNQKAILYDLIILKDPSAELYGVATISDDSHTPIITVRYASVEFKEGNENFIVKTTDGKYGIIDKEGITKVKPTYDAIEEINNDVGLYLVTTNGKQGIINQNGKTIVYQEYEKIGLEDTNEDKNVKNKYVLFDSCIPVKANGKWGLIDKDGNVIVPLEYNGIGCRLGTSQGNTTGITIIPEMNGIILRKDIKNGNITISKYGIVDSKGNMLVDFEIDSAYSTVASGEVTYYVSSSGQAIDIVKYWKEQTGGTKNNNTEQNAEENNEQSQEEQGNQEQTQNEEQTVENSNEGEQSPGETLVYDDINQISGGAVISQ